ncbi:MAG TPA: fructose-bisphosphatase class II family protein [Candidatus Eisenbacteria bacterium]|jgi:fructose-1,6-bisphosphatase II|nr:fructose-bisphosphatase class II family protein [Candidatus Eisenbacteria bacterium]
MKDINLDIVRVTEAAAIAASAWVGSGDKKAADKAATDAMRSRLNGIDFKGRVVIGEGIKDESAGLFAGETVGSERSLKVYDLAVDPIEGTRPTAHSGPEALSVMAVAEKGALFSTSEFYMNKFAYGPEIARKTILSITDPLEKTIRLVSKATGKEPRRIMVCLLDRPRHEPLVAELRGLGVRIKLIQDCDVSAAIAACLPESGIDLLCGIGGAPEGILTACAIKCLRGEFQAQIVHKDGSVEPRILSLDDLVSGECVFSATGITDGSLLRGVRYTPQGPVTNSIFMRSASGTVRRLTAYHGN